MTFDAKRVMAEIRRRDPELADAIDREEAEPTWCMTEGLRARLDAWMHGQGYLIGGMRVDPAMVTIVRTPE